MTFPKTCQRQTPIRGEICLLLFLQVFAHTAAVNVALDKPGTYCMVKHLSNALFDGNIETIETITESCGLRSSVEINLGALYFINYVITFPAGGNKHGELDYFKVYNILYSNSTVKHWCGQYPNRNDGSPMRVNCKFTTQTYSTVQVESLLNLGLNISEIEVHSFGSEVIDSVMTLIYRGCFENVVYKGEQQWRECIVNCYNRGFLFTSIKGTHCGCIITLDGLEEVDASHCDMNCDNIIMCGGKDTYSIYMLFVPLPYHRGCIDVPGDRVRIEGYKGVTTVATCLDRCKDQKFALIQEGTYCLCTNKIEERKVEMNKCNHTCSGDKDEVCGGMKHASLYSTCKDSLADNRVSCSEVFNCFGKVNVFQECQGHCMDGFIGRACIERDIDECALEPCDNDTSVCVNLEVLYICECRQGFHRTLNNLCLHESEPIESTLMDHLIPYQLRMFIIIGIPMAAVNALLTYIGHRLVMNHLLNKQRKNTQFAGGETRESNKWKVSSVGRKITKSTSVGKGHRPGKMATFVKKSTVKSKSQAAPPASK